MNFHVGQKVVCVNDDCIEAGVLGPLKKGRIYTIRETGLRAWTDGAPCVRLTEIIRGPLCCEGGEEECDTPYWASRFRPIVRRKTDISVFTAMLKPAKETIKAQTWGELRLRIRHVMENISHR